MGGENGRHEEARKWYPGGWEGGVASSACLFGIEEVPGMQDFAVLQPGQPGIVAPSSTG